MGKAAHRKFGAAWLLAGTLHCSLLANFDNFTGASATTVPILDGSVSDGATPKGPPQVDAEAVLFSSDAAQDGNSSVDGGSSSNSGFCTSKQPTPTFCEDYDRDPIGSDWETTNRPDGAAGTVATDLVESLSRPASRRITIVGKSPSTTCQYVYETRVSTIPYSSKLRVENALFIGSPSSSTGVPDSLSALNSLTLSAADGSGGCYMYVSAGSGQNYFYIEREAAPYTQKKYSMRTPVPIRRWTNIGIEVAGAGGQAPVVTLTIDGVEALEAIPIPPELGCKHGRVKDIQNGFFCTRATNDSELRVDNLAIWAE